MVEADQTRAFGLISGLTDENKSVGQSYHYEEFGNLEDDWGDVDDHYRYTGQEFDDEISGAELYNLRARYYETGIGRFISEDPILQAGYVCPRSYTTKSPQALNQYPYVQNNPINFVDPLGFDACLGPFLPLPDYPKQPSECITGDFINWLDCFTYFANEYTHSANTQRYLGGKASRGCPIDC